MIVQSVIIITARLQVDSVRDVIQNIDVSHVAMLRIVAELLTMVSLDSVVQ